MKKYSPEKKEKLANTLIYFAEKIPNISKTKIIKLLYLLEEFYVRKHNIPFLDIDFEVWQAGPVNRETYIELSDNPLVLKGYIERVTDGDNTYIKPIKSFSDDEFSDNEIEMMDFIITHFKDKSSKELVDYVHRPGSAWYNIAKENNLLPLFEKHFINSSEEKINFEFFCQSEEGIAQYREQKMFNSLV
jgi:uncharacterized phage-associated protein